MPGHVAMTIVSPAKMRGKNLRFLPTSFPFHAAPTLPPTSRPPSLSSPHATPSLVLSPFNPLSLTHPLFPLHPAAVVCRAGICIMEL